MARPKEFDRDEVLDRAVELFWQKGYEATSMADLVEGLGVGRQSLYDTFGDKHALYLAALDRYVRGHSAAAAFATGQPIRKQLRALFTGLVARVTTHKERGACLLGAAVVERCPGDVDVAARFLRETRHLESALTDRLREAQAEGEIGAHHDAAGLARYFVNALYGLQLTARANPDRTFLEPIVDVTLSILG